MKKAPDIFTLSGREYWQAKIAATLGLESTMRHRGRPRKPLEKSPVSLSCPGESCEGSLGEPRGRRTHPCHSNPDRNEMESYFGLDCIGVVELRSGGDTRLGSMWSEGVSPGLPVGTRPPLLQDPAVPSMFPPSGPL